MGFFLSLSYGRPRLSLRRAGTGAPGPPPTPLALPVGPAGAPGSGSRGRRGGGSPEPSVAGGGSTPPAVPGEEAERQSPPVQPPLPVLPAQSQAGGGDTAAVSALRVTKR